MAHGFQSAQQEVSPAVRLGVIALFMTIAAAVPAAVEQSKAAPDPAVSVREAQDALRRGRYQQALAQFADAADVYIASGQREAEARVNLHKVTAYLALGRFPDGIAAARRSLRAAEQLEDEALALRAKASLGNALLMSGDVANSERVLLETIDEATLSQNSEVAAMARNDLASLYAPLGRLQAAVELFDAAVSDADAAGDAGLAAKASVNLARAVRDAKDRQRLPGLLDAAKQRLTDIPDSHDKAFGLLALARLHAPPQRRASGDSAMKAQQALIAAAATADTIGDDRASSYALGFLGKLYEDAERYDEALVLTRRADAAAQRTGAAEIIYHWQWQLGRLYLALSDPDPALNAYLRAVNTLQGVRQDLTAGFSGSQLSFREQVGPLYLQLADLLLRRATAEPAGQQRDQWLRDARQTVELLKGAELADYFQDDCVAQFKSRSAGIDKLAAGTVAIYPIILADRTELLVSLPDGIKLLTVPVDATTMNREIHAFRALLEKRTTHQYMAYARKLYDRLIRPLEPELDRYDIDTLVLVPDGALRTIPFSALHDGEKFLIEKYALATSPGLTLTDPRPIRRDDVRLLVSALTESVQGFPALPDVESEIEAISKIYGGTVLRNAEFVIPKLASELTGKIFSIVHIASHGQFSGDLKDTFLLTYDTKLSMDSLGDLLGATAYREEPVELLTLSACQTAAGDDRAALGLAGIAVKAGARSAMATLWFINDRASSLLVSQFYQHLSDPSLSKAAALQRAQTELIADRYYRHPVYWSPFLMIGNWL